MQVKKFNCYACDFETTVYDNQEDTEVWAACWVKLFTNDEPEIVGSIEHFFMKMFDLPGNNILFFHNLKFDGSFIADYLIRGHYTFNRVPEKEMENNQFKTAISERGQWYNIIIKKNNRIIEIRDSLKLLPFTLKRIGDAFETTHKKLEMEYKGYRYKNCPIKESEKNYIKNDVLVLKEALEIMFNEGHNSITIGSCCLKEFKSFYDKIDYNNLFPNLYEIEIDDKYGQENAGEYIRKSYKGGYCYLKPEHANKIIKGGLTLDVNSLYPSMMHSISGNFYPTGRPRFTSDYGEFKEKVKKSENFLYFVRFECRFKVKENYLPTVQIKGNMLYKGTEYLTTSDIYYKGEYHRYYRDLENNVKEAKVVLTMTRPDFETFFEHYNVYDFKFLDCCYFFKQKGIFDEYINKYRDIKMTSKGAKRELAKLYLNNLYGKEASSTDSSYKVPYINPDKNCLSFNLVEEKEKTPGYIAIGSYITSYARNFTIKAAQKNYDNFIYSDTDSIHLTKCTPKSVRIHDKNFCCWKKESEWDKGLFVRQKTYIERVTKEDKPCKPKMEIKCAGMSDRAKQNFLSECKMEDFKIGLRVKGNLNAKRIKGGIVLVESFYEMRK